MTDLTMSSCGMPPLSLDPARPLSHFEFWPGEAFYAPIALYALWLGFRYGFRSSTCANPTIEAGGLVGESKSAVLSLATGDACDWIAPWTSIVRGTGDSATEADRAEAALRAANLPYPVVAKPDLGCRGMGVRPIASRDELLAYLDSFPHGQRLVLQTLIDWEPEASVLWARGPNDLQGRILSLTLKYFPRVTGDGMRTLRQLIEADPRAGKVAHLYLARHAARLDEVIAAGEQVRLVFSGSHSKGAIFRNGKHFATEALARRLDAIANDVPGLHVARFDVRCASIAQLAMGEGFRIVEINGVGGEAIHVWDSRTRLLTAWRDLCAQTRTSYVIGAANRARGAKPLSWSRLYFLWRRHLRLKTAFPTTA
ncbi:hypothetical protein [Roseiterribacter gracilis]|uniref:ATP-grasp domain-containing protein n=1 Tax=Roseiterribacter gracilis TaxID=2812848 RepID=A0A8S8XFM6_9PROT|nr:hypothetical protein TMPK1_24640 [Rhodospirillales bacterium TMPK1]